MANIEEEKPNEKEVEVVRCAECRTILKEGDRECPKCGSTQKTRGPGIFNVKAKDGFRTRADIGGVHKAQMSPQSWAIFGLISALVIPPVVYAVFYILAIALWYKILIWIGVIFIAFCLTRNYRVIKCLRFIGDKAYGKNKL